MKIESKDQYCLSHELDVVLLTEQSDVKDYEHRQDGLCISARVARETYFFIIHLMMVNVVGA